MYDDLAVYVLEKKLGKKFQMKVLVKQTNAAALLQQWVVTVASKGCEIGIPSSSRICNHLATRQLMGTTQADLIKITYKIGSDH